MENKSTIFPGHKEMADDINAGVKLINEQMKKDGGKESHRLG